MSSFRKFVIAIALPLFLVSCAPSVPSDTIKKDPSHAVDTRGWLTYTAPAGVPFSFRYPPTMEVREGEDSIILSEKGVETDPKSDIVFTVLLQTSLQKQIAENFYDPVASAEWARSKVDDGNTSAVILKYFQDPLARMRTYLFANYVQAGGDRNQTYPVVRADMTYNYERPTGNIAQSQVDAYNDVNTLSPFEEVLKTFQMPGGQ